MGFLGRLFGGGVRKPPAWAREAFGKDGDNFKTFIDVVTYVLHEHAGEDEYITAEPEYVATGSVVIGEGMQRREWHMLDAALACSMEADHGKWDAIVGASLAEALGRSSGAPAAPEASSDDAPKRESRRLRVLAHMTMNDLEAADALATEAIAAGDEVVDMHHQRAMIALMRGDEAAADAHLANIDTAQSLTSRATIAARRNDPAAMELALRALERLPGDVIAIRAAIIVHALAGARDKARALLADNAQHLDTEMRIGLENAIENPPRQFGHIFPEHAKLVFDVAKPMIDAGEYEKAEPLIRRAAAWDPENLGFAADLGFTLSKLSRDADAIAVYDAAIARGGGRVLLRFNRGNCLVRRHKFDEAAADFRACVELKADWHEARINLVSALFASGDKTGARREIEQLKTLGGPPQFVTSLEKMLAGTL